MILLINAVPIATVLKKYIENFRHEKNERKLRSFLVHISEIR